MSFFVTLLCIDVLSGTLMGDPVVMVNFYPEFPESVMSSMSTCGEFVFVMDRSGSMGCNMHNGPGAEKRIECARVRAFAM